MLHLRLGAGVHGVFQEIDQGRVHGRLVQAGHAGIGSHRENEIHPAAFGLGFGRFGQFAGERGRVHHLAPGLPALGVIEDVEDHLADARDLVAHDVPAFPELGRIAPGEAQVHLVHAPVQGGQKSLDPVGHEPEHESQGGEVVLELADLGDVGGDFHHLIDLPGFVSQGRGLDEHVALFPGQGGDHGFVGVGLAVLEAPDHGAADAGRIAVAEKRVAGSGPLRAEVVAETAVGLDQAKVAVHHGDGGQHGVEQALELLPGGPQFFLESLDLGHVHGELQHEFHGPVLAADGRGMYDDRNLPAFPVEQGFMAALGTAGLDGLPDRAGVAAAAAPGVGLPGILPDQVAQAVLAQLVRGHDFQITVVDGQKAGQFIEIAGPLVAGGGQALHGQGEALHA